MKVLCQWHPHRQTEEREIRRLSPSKRSSTRVVPQKHQALSGMTSLLLLTLGLISPISTAGKGMQLSKQLHNSINCIGIQIHYSTDELDKLLFCCYKNSLSIQLL